MNAIADEKYVRLTTYTADGTAKPVPVWIAPLDDGTVGFTTELDSWKVKRIRNTSNVELVASDMRGKAKAGAEPVTGRATVVVDAEFERVMDAIKAKYGFQVTAIRALAKLGRLVGRSGEASNCGIVIALD